MHRYQICPKEIETIKAIQYTTDWTPRNTTYIASDEHEAIRNLEQDEPDVKVFTDGSGMQGTIGAAAVLYRNRRKKSELRMKLGPQ
jgi:hypothetical protein